jgi:1,2-diacylglycerol 3-alpha-glucosyltransferase
MTVIEAECAGIPIIVADVRGIRELLSDNGLLFTAGDLDGLAQAMRRMLEDGQAVGRFKLRSAALKPLFDGDQVARRFEELYAEARGIAARAG